MLLCLAAGLRGSTVSPPKPTMSDDEAFAVGAQPQALLQPQRRNTVARNARRRANAAVAAARQRLRYRVPDAVRICWLCFRRPRGPDFIKVCAKCTFATYCSNECHEEHWYYHKHQCELARLLAQHFAQWGNITTLPEIESLIKPVMDGQILDPEQDKTINILDLVVRMWTSVTSEHAPPPRVVN